MIIGLQTKGIFACPRCAEQFEGRYSKDLHKVIYANNRVFLPPDHKFRSRLKNQFDGKIENKPPPKVMGPADWLKMYGDAESKAWNHFFRHDHSIEEPEQVMVEMPKGMKRKSIFYDLPYWKDLLISHLIDPMHVFKNVPDSIFRHISSKDKDTLSSRRDIALSRTKFDRRHLWPSKENESYAEAPWILKRKELDQLKNVIRSIRTPTGYGSSLNKAFTVEGHITGFKTHDYHNFMKVLTSINCYSYHLLTKTYFDIL